MSRKSRLKRERRLQEQPGTVENEPRETLKDLRARRAQEGQEWEEALAARDREHEEMVKRWGDKIAPVVKRWWEKLPASEYGDNPCDGCSLDGTFLECPELTTFELCSLQGGEGWGAGLINTSSYCAPHAKELAAEIEIPIPAQLL